MLSLHLVMSMVVLWFDKNKTACILWTMKILDPSFSKEAFNCELWEYIVLEVVDAYLSADNKVLKSWCLEAMCLLLYLLY